MSKAETRSVVEEREDAILLAECDFRALERFQLLDAMEAEDERIITRRKNRQMAPASLQFLR